MKKLVAKKNVECMACLQCMQACTEAFYKESSADYAAIQIVEGKNGAAKVNACIQCGKCMKACEHGAITQNPKTGVYMINKKLCTNCGKCIEICPMKVMVADPTSKCISCGICAKACPMGILEVVEK